MSNYNEDEEAKKSRDECSCMVNEFIRADVSLQEHSAPYLRKLNSKELADIIKSDKYGECTKDRARYILI